MKHLLLVFCVVLMISACRKNNPNPGRTTADVIYLENNDFHAGSMTINPMFPSQPFNEPFKLNPLAPVLWQ